MPYLTAAVILVGLLCSANMLLLLGVVRRLREHERLLPQAAAVPFSLGLPPVGSAMPSFTALSTTGGPVDSDFLPLPAVIAFFDVGCEPCREEAPRFARQAVARPELNALAVVVGEAGPMSAVLEESCLVVVEPAGGSVAEAFGVRGFPAMCLLDERGVIAATGSDLTVLTSAPVRPGARR